MNFETTISITPTECLIWTNTPAHTKILSELPCAVSNGEGSWSVPRRSIRKLDQFFTLKAKGMAREISTEQRQRFMERMHPGKANVDSKLAGVQ